MMKKKTGKIELYISVEVNHSKQDLKIQITIKHSLEATLISNLGHSSSPTKNTEVKS
jgi:hypothetical protein